MKTISLFFCILGGLAVLGEEYNAAVILLVIAYLLKE